MLTLNGKKMSKSTGNTLLPNELFNSLIKNYYPLLKKVKNISWNSSHSRDINDGNFGYDLNGNLKMLDI